MTKPTALEYPVLMLRAWWWSLKPASKQQEKMPAAVRNFMLYRVVKNGKKLLSSGTLSAEQLEKMYLVCMENALSCAEQREKFGIRADIVNEMVGLAMTCLGNIPTEECEICHRPTLRHEGSLSDSGFVCEACQKEKAESKELLQ